MGEDLLRVGGARLHVAEIGRCRGDGADISRQALTCLAVARGAMFPVQRLRWAPVLLRDRRTWYDWVRPGLLLYGIVPPPLAAASPHPPALPVSFANLRIEAVTPPAAPAPFR